MSSEADEMIGTTTRIREMLDKIVKENRDLLEENQSLKEEY